MASITKRRVLVAVLGLVALAAVACEGAYPPLTIQNSMDERITISIVEDGIQRTLSIGPQNLGPFKDSMEIPSGATQVIHFGGIEPQGQYSLTINYALGTDTKHETFLN